MDAAENLDFEFAKWIERQCEQPGFSRKGLSEATGIPIDVISKITTGTRQLKASELELARRYFRPDWSFDFSDLSPPEPVLEIQSGAYLAPPYNPRVVSDPAISPASFPGRTVFKIVGDGMNALSPRPVMHGDYVVCRPLDLGRDDFSKLHHGQVVVAERIFSEHRLRETALRQVDTSTGRLELPMRSKDEELANFLPLDPSSDKEQLRIIGIVEQIFTPVPSLPAELQSQGHAPYVRRERRRSA